MATTSEAPIVICPSCGQKNRIGTLAPDKQPVCGRCGADLPAPAGSEPVTVTDATFEAEVLRSPVPVLLDCWAPWCGPCRTMGPVVEQLAGELAGRVKVAKLNMDENPRTAGRLGIRSIPAFLVFQGGRAANQVVGAVPKAELLRALQPYLK